MFIMMYRIFSFVCLLLLSCNMAADNSLDKGKTPTDTVVAQPPQVPPSHVEPPKLQAVKWSGMKEMTDESFKKEVLASSALTLVDFNAEWCGPCKQLEPILEQLVKEYDGRINFASVDVDECPDAARYYNVSSIPLLAFYQNAKQGNTIFGLQHYENLKKMIDNELKKPE